MIFTFTINLVVNIISYQPLTVFLCYIPGSKALTNMSEQFSKLNKLSHSLNARARPSLQLKFDQGSSRTKKMFTLGGKPDSKKKGSLSDGMSSDYSSDDEHRTNIFEPTLDNYENTQHYIGEASQQKDRENDCELIQNPLYSSKIEPSETFDPTVVIASTVEKQSIKTPSNISKRNPFDLESDAVSNSRTPEIQIENEGVYSKPIPPTSLILSQKLSHSSSDITYEDNPNLQTEGVNYHRSNSQHEITLNIAQSHSESALRQFKNMASPVSSATKDMVLSPLSKLAKGVQSLGANLDPRKMKVNSDKTELSTSFYLALLYPRLRLGSH